MKYLLEKTIATLIVFVMVFNFSSITLAQGFQMSFRTGRSKKVLNKTILRTNKDEKSYVSAITEMNNTIFIICKII